MAINRAPFNALVDDDGSNTLGSPWNKQAIKDVILDPVDAAIGPAPVATVLTHASGLDAHVGAFTFVSAAFPAGTVGQYDTLEIEVEATFPISSTNVFLLWQQASTDYNLATLSSMGNAAAGGYTACRITLRRYMTSDGAIFVLTVGGANPGAVFVSIQTITSWPGAFSLALQHSGVAAGGQVVYKWTVRKITG